MATKKASKKKKISKIKPDIVLVSDGDRDLKWYRDQLGSVEQYCWDKCKEGLDSTKATGKWPDFMLELQRLKTLVDIKSEDVELELDWDTVATTEAFYESA